jgi:hypothetical protein
VWKLKRTTQCAKCPWHIGVNPHDIPNGYDVEKHRALKNTIAKQGDLSGLFSNTLRIMACHESHDAHCVGWLMNQIRQGNNIPLRLHMLSCENGRELRVIGEQYETFEKTLPDS